METQQNFATDYDNQIILEAPVFPLFLQLFDCTAAIYQTHQSITSPHKYSTMFSPGIKWGTKCFANKTSKTFIFNLFCLQ